MGGVEGGGVVISVDNEEAEQDNEGHGEKNNTIKHIFSQTKCTKQLKDKFY